MNRAAVSQNAAVALKTTGALRASAVLSHPKLLQLALAGLLLVLWFALLGQRALTDPDEGRYAEIPREMVASGDWITPRLNDLIYLEKPPLQYWATAVAFDLFGERNWTARLWCALTGLAGVLFAAYAALRLHSARAALYAGLVLGSGVLYFGMAHLNTLDAGVTFFMAAVMFSLALGLRSEASLRARRNWIRVAWLAAGFAILSKGLIGIALPVCALGLYSLLYRDYRVWREVGSPSGAALMLLVTVPWFVAVARANPDFLKFFFIHEHFTRFTTTEHHHYQPWWFFVPVLALGALPWTLPVLAGVWRGARAGPPSGFRPLGLLAVWCAVVFSFFSPSGSKLVPYILPMFPALAVLGAVYMCEARPRALALQVGVAGLTASVALAVAPYVLVPKFASPELTRWFWIAGIAWAAAAVSALVAMRRSAFDGSVIAIAVTAMLAHQVVLHAVEFAAPHRSAYALAQDLKPYVRDATRVYSVGLFMPSLSFYLERPSTLVEFRGELDFGLTREPHKGIATTQAFVERWLSESDAVAVMKKDTYRELAARGVPMQLVSEDARRVAVRRP